MNCIADFTFLGLFFIAGLQNIAAEEFPVKIVGGTQASPGEFPWIVALKFSSNHTYFCGGVIYKPYWIVTAAKCGCSNPSQYEVVAGEYRLTVDDKTEQTRSVLYMICHPDFNPNTLEYNIAIWRLITPFDFNNDSVKAAQLAQTNFIPADTVTLAGWGFTSIQGPISNILLKATFPMVPYSKCWDLYYSAGINRNVYELCAGAVNMDACTRDTGGPLHSDSTVCGIVSYAFGCGNPDLPGERKVSPSGGINVKNVAIP